MSAYASRSSPRSCSSRLPVRISSRTRHISVFLRDHSFAAWYAGSARIRCRASGSFTTRKRAPVLMNCFVASSHE